MVASLVVLTIVMFIGADLLVQWMRARQAKPVRVSHPSQSSVADLLMPALQAERFSMPAGLFFHRGHTWANLLFSGQIKVGIDDFIQKLLGHIDAVTLPPVGVAVKQGQPFVAIRQGGRTATLAAPVDGVVCAVNTELAKMPGLLRRDPYTRGWMVALRPTNLSANLAQLAVGATALSWLTVELARLREFLAATLTREQDALVGATAADGGLVADGLLEHLDNDVWADFQAKFLNG